MQSAVAATDVIYITLCAWFTYLLHCGAVKPMAMCTGLDMSTEYNQRTHIITCTDRQLLQNFSATAHVAGFCEKPCLLMYLHLHVTQESIADQAVGAGIEATQVMHEETEGWSSEVAALQAVYEGMIAVLSPGCMCFETALPQVCNTGLAMHAYFCLP